MAPIAGAAAHHPRQHLARVCVTFPTVSASMRGIPGAGLGDLAATTAAPRGRGVIAILRSCSTRSARCRSSATARSNHFRSEEHTSELQSLMRISYAVFCLKKKKNQSHEQKRIKY